jgi:Integrase core domain
MKLGIVPERIAAGHPEQNGRHERMHRTLKQETASPPAATRRAQQRALDRFRREYNEERPQEALDLGTPSAVYTLSPREYPRRVPEPEYGSALDVRRVQKWGQFHWKHQHVFLTETLIGESIGLLPVDDRFYTVYFAAFPIARFDSRRLVIVPRLKKDEEDFSGGKRKRKRKRKCPLPLHPIPSKHRRKKCQGCARSKVSGMSPTAHCSAPPGLGKGGGNGSPSG